MNYNWEQLFLAFFCLSTMHNYAFAYVKCIRQEKEERGVLVNKEDCLLASACTAMQCVYRRYRGEFVRFMQFRGCQLEEFRFLKTSWPSNREGDPSCRVVFSSLRYYDSMKKPEACAVCECDDKDYCMDVQKMEMEVERAKKLLNQSVVTESIASLTTLKNTVSSMSGKKPGGEKEDGGEKQQVDENGNPINGGMPLRPIGVVAAGAMAVVMFAVINTVL